MRCIKHVWTRNLLLKWLPTEQWKEIAEHFASVSCCLEPEGVSVMCKVCWWKSDLALLSHSQRWLTWCPVAMVLLWRWTESQVGGGVCVCVCFVLMYWCVWVLGLWLCCPLAIRLCVPALQATSCGVRTTALPWWGSTCTLVTRWDTPPTCPSPWKRCAFSPSPLPTSRQTRTPRWNGATSLWRSKRPRKRNSCKKLYDFLQKKQSLVNLHRTPAAVSAVCLYVNYQKQQCVWCSIQSHSPNNWHTFLFKIVLLYNSRTSSVFRVEHFRSCQ